MLSKERWLCKERIYTVHETKTHVDNFMHSSFFPLFFYIILFRYIDFFMSLMCFYENGGSTNISIRNLKQFHDVYKGDQLKREIKLNANIFLALK